MSTIELASARDMAFGLYEMLGTEAVPPLIRRSDAQKL